MRRLLNHLLTSCTILLLSVSTSIGQEKEPMPNCPEITFGPANEICGGWETSQACAGNAAFVRVFNTSECNFESFRIAPAPHSQGASFSICRGNGAAGVSRQHCSTDPVFLQLGGDPLAPKEELTFTIFSDRPADFLVETFCKSAMQRCMTSVHVETYPGQPSPYPTEPAPHERQHPTDPTHPSDPTQPGQPTQPSPYEGTYESQDVPNSGTTVRKY